MLASVAVLAVVGGALAFKAKTFSAELYCTPADNWVGHATLVTSTFYEPQVGGTQKFCNPNTYKNLTTAQVEATTVVVE